MNWEAISAIAEAVGLIVIVASLIYISLQTKQANDHATASSEIGFMEGVNDVFKGWATDEHTATVIREGLRSFEGLEKHDQALFDARVGAIVNQMILGEKLADKNLLSPEIADEVKKVAIAVLSTDGGLEYWEHASKITPGGPELLELVKRVRGQQPSIADLAPWWNSN